MSLTPFVYVDLPLDGVNAGAVLHVDEATAKHLTTVLRLRAGAQVVVSDGLGRSATGELCDATTVKLATAVSEQAPARVAVTLAQGVPKLKKMDTVVRLATEGGAAAVWPVVTSRSPVKHADVQSSRQQERLLAVRQAAGEQARRVYRLALHEATGFSAACDALNGTPWLVCDAAGMAVHEAMRTVGPAAVNAGTLTVMVGPEGGFSAEELREAITAGAVVVRLADSVLRSEHAGLFAVGAVSTLLAALPEV